MINIHIKNKVVEGFLSIVGEKIGKGGIRLISNASLEETIELAKIMDKKVKFHNIVGWCGAKASIKWDGKQDKKVLLKAFIDEIKYLIPQRYISAPDVNTTAKEMDYIESLLGKGSVTGTSRLSHELGSTGFGVAVAIKEACKYLDIKNPKVSIAGFGNVGKAVAECLANADISASDINMRKIKGVKKILLKDIYTTKTDVLVPCAVSNVINRENMGKIDCKLIVEGANNPMTEEVRMFLRDKGILIIPDYVANAGGVISSLCELNGVNQEDMFKAVEEKIKVGVKKYLNVYSKK